MLYPRPSDDLCRAFCVRCIDVLEGQGQDNVTPLVGDLEGDTSLGNVRWEVSREHFDGPQCIEASSLKIGELLALIVAGERALVPHVEEEARHRCLSLTLRHAGRGPFAADQG